MGINQPNYCSEGKVLKSDVAKNIATVEVSTNQTIVQKVGI